MNATPPAYADQLLDGGHRHQQPARPGPPPCPAPATCPHVFHCPACGAGSANPGDAQHSWCGACGDVAHLIQPHEQQARDGDTRPESPSSPLPGP